MFGEGIRANYILSGTTIVFKNRVGEHVKGKQMLGIGIRLLNFLGICKFWKFPRENKESEHRGRNWSNVAPNQGMPTASKAERGKKQMVP